MDETPLHSMDESPVAHNCAARPTQREIMTQVAAHGFLADLINKLASVTVCYWWKLLGDDANSLSKLLDISWMNLRLILRKCGILYGPADSFRTAQFKKFMFVVGRHYTVYRPKGKSEQFLKIGDKLEDLAAVGTPKEMYLLGGVLNQMPVVGVHLPGVRTKISRRLATKLIDAVTDVQSSSSESMDSSSEADNDNNKGSMTTYINDLLVVAKQEIMCASRQGEKYTFTQRAERVLRKAAVIAIKCSIDDVFDAWVDRMEGAKEVDECLSTPPVNVGRASVSSELQRRDIFGPPNQPAEDSVATLVTPPVDLTDDVDVEVDERDVDIVLTEMREQTILQNLLQKNILQKNERMIILEHKNGRKLRVFVPPDCQSTKSFIEEASKSQWVKDMLHTPVLQQGMLMYLAKTQPDQYLKVGKKKKLRIITAALSTPKTMALGCLTGINNTQMSKLRLFLRVVGNADLKLFKSETERIDRDVGLHAMVPSASFDNYTLEWSTTSGNNVEKKGPEHCSFWNSDLLVEVASEIDLLFHTMFTEKLDMTAVTSLDYYAPGFTEKPGIVVLFGGDHGAGNCPCSLKLNFSSPQQRKERRQLNWRCPTIQIASIECTKDSFELLSRTIMPTIKAQLIDLRNSSACVVHSQRFPRKYRKAIILPKSIQQYTLVVINGVLSFFVGINQRTIDLRPYFNAHTEEADFAFHDLVVVKVISNFNDLYVGDLAFLSMAIGMNDSSGAHCMHCKKKACEFNSNVEQQDIRTKASLTECLNRFIAESLRVKSVRNNLGVNTVGLLDIEPKQIIVPILHCPMGLVDKVLEVFKAWTVLDVEELPAEANVSRDAFKNAKALHAAATIHETNMRIVNEASGTPESRAMFREAKQAAADAKKAVKEARTNYKEMVKRHNSRLYSLSQEYDTIFRSNGIKKRTLSWREVQWC